MGDRVAPAPPALPVLRFRRPVEADHAAIVRIVDEWWGGRRVHQLLPRLWFQHFTGTSWIAETSGGRLAGFLVAFRSPDRPDEACIHMAATDPNLRRRGVGRALYERFFDEMRALGVRRVGAVAWPGDRVAVSFHLALGFRPDDAPGSQRLYGTPAFADYDFPGEDRARFILEL